MRYAFIRSEAGRYLLTLMCRVMQVCRSGSYAFCRRLPSQRAAAEARLRLHVRAAFTASRGRYGSPRVHAELRAQGIRTCRKRVARLVQQQLLAALKGRRSHKITGSRHTQPVAPNRVMRHFGAEAADRLWRGDKTWPPSRSPRPWSSTSPASTTPCKDTPAWAT